MISWVRDCRDEYVSTTDTNGTKDEDGLAAIWKLINSLPLKGSSWEIRRDWTMALIIVLVVRVRATLAKRYYEVVLRCVATDNQYRTSGKESYERSRTIEDGWLLGLSEGYMTIEWEQMLLKDALNTSEWRLTSDEGWLLGVSEGCWFREAMDQRAKCWVRWQWHQKLKEDTSWTSGRQMCVLPLQTYHELKDSDQFITNHRRWLRRRLWIEGDCFSSVEEGCS